MKLNKNILSSEKKFFLKFEKVIKIKGNKYKYINLY